MAGSQPAGARQSDGQFRDFLSTRPKSEVLSLRKRVCLLETNEELRNAGKTPRFPVEFTSQYGEDCFLWELFRGKLDGFFIEVGAFDGYTFSVTYALEALGWSGLLIEPLPERFEAARTRRPGSRVVHGALGSGHGKAPASFTAVDGEATAMLSFLSTTPENFADIRASGAATRQVPVPVTTMNALLEDHRGPIDVAVIDVEGGEVELLKGFDLNKFRPRVLMVEEGIPSRTSSAMQYLAAFPYTPVAYAWVNRVYVRNDETELLRNAKAVGMW